MMYSLYAPCTYVKQFKHTLYNFTCTYTCIQDIRQWLQEIIVELSSTGLNSSAKLAAAVVLMCCAHNVCTSIPDSMCLTLLKMMALQPDGVGIIFLQSLMKNESMSRYIIIVHGTILSLRLLVLQLCRSLIAMSLITIMDQIISRRKSEYTIDLLKALPLLHFIRGDCFPNEQLVVQPSKIEWLDGDIQLGTVRSIMLFVRGSVEIK